MRGSAGIGLPTPRARAQPTGGVGRGAPRRRPRRAGAPLRRATALWLLALLVVPILELGLFEAWHDSPTYDEGIYLASGLDLVTSHQWRLTLEHPPLSRAIAVLPALLAHPVLPASAAIGRGDEYAWSRAVLGANEVAGRLRLVVFMARLIPLAEAIAAGLLAYAVATELTDRAGGVLAAGLWLTLPTTLAFGHLLSIDMSLSLVTMALAWAVLCVARRPGPRSVVTLGVLTGGALLVRSTTLPVVPIVALLAAAAATGLVNKLPGDVGSDMVSQGKHFRRPPLAARASHRLLPNARGGARGTAPPAAGVTGHQPVAGAPGAPRWTPAPSPVVLAHAVARGGFPPRAVRPPAVVAGTPPAVAAGPPALGRASPPGGMTAPAPVPPPALVPWLLGVSLAARRGPQFGAALRRATVRGLGAAAAVGAVALATLWAGVRLLAPVSATLPSAQAFPVPFTVPAPVPPAEELVARLPWPHEFSVGLRLLGRLSPAGPGYALGHHWTGAWWAYWPVTVAAKIPVSALILLVLGLAGWWGLASGRRGRAATVLVPLAIAIGLPAAVTNRQLGVRLILPLIALAAVAAAPAARLRGAPAGRVILAALCVAQTGALASAGGAALAWTQPPLHPGYRSVADSSLDWGQDYRGLARWAPGRDAWIAYFGPPGLTDHISVGTKNLLDAPPSTVQGWVAVSASYLDAYRATQLSWLRAYCPVDIIGSTILVYRLDRAPDTRSGPATPAAPCRGAPFSKRRA